MRGDNSHQDRQDGIFCKSEQLQTPGSRARQSCERQCANLASNQSWRRKRLPSCAQTTGGVSAREACLTATNPAGTRRLARLRQDRPSVLCDLSRRTLRPSKLEQPAWRLGNQIAGARVLAAEASATIAAVQNAWTDYQRRPEVVASRVRIGDKEDVGSQPPAAGHTDGLDAASARLQEVLASAIKKEVDDAEEAGVPGPDSSTPAGSTVQEVGGQQRSVGTVDLPAPGNAAQRRTVTSVVLGSQGGQQSAPQGSRQQRTVAPAGLAADLGGAPVVHGAPDSAQQPSPRQPQVTPSV